MKYQYLVFSFILKVIQRMNFFQTVAEMSSERQETEHNYKTEIVAGAVQKTPIEVCVICEPTPQNQSQVIF